jgi:hypothetical protein
MLSYLHRVKDGRNIYYFANSTDEPVETEVILRGKMTLQKWNPHTGETQSVPTVPTIANGVAFTRAPLQLDGVKSVFFVETITP